MTDFSETLRAINTAHHLLDQIRHNLLQIENMANMVETDPQEIQSAVTGTDFKDLYKGLPAAMQAIQGAAVNADRADKGLERL